MPRPSSITCSELSWCRITCTLLACPGQRLVDAVVDDFLGQVVGPRGVGVHARALAHRVETGEDFDGFGGVRHGVW